MVYIRSSESSYTIDSVDVRIWNLKRCLLRANELYSVVREETGTLLASVRVPVKDIMDPEVVDSAMH